MYCLSDVTGIFQVLIVHLPLIRQEEQYNHNILQPNYRLFTRIMQTSGLSERNFYNANTNQARTPAIKPDEPPSLSAALVVTIAGREVDVPVLIATMDLEPVGAVPLEPAPTLIVTVFNFPFPELLSTANAVAAAGGAPGEMLIVLTLLLPPRTDSEITDGLVWRTDS